MSTLNNILTPRLYRKVTFHIQRSQMILFEQTGIINKRTPLPTKRLQSAANFFTQFSIAIQLLPLAITSPLSEFLRASWPFVSCLLKSSRDYLISTKNGQEHRDVRQISNPLYPLRERTNE